MGELAGLWFLTDPVRSPDPVAVAKRLPAGAVVVFRAFGAADAMAVGVALRRVTLARRQTLLIGADPMLAKALRADGVHLPERLWRLAPRLRHAHPRWIVTAAAHGRAAAHTAARQFDAVLVSAIFASSSPSAGRPIGAVRLARLARQAKAPVVALGGIKGRTAARAAGGGIYGLAAIEALVRT